MLKKWNELTVWQREQVDQTYIATQFQQDSYLYQVASSGTVLSRWKMSQELDDLLPHARRDPFTHEYH
jgi:hypothetical protein